MPADDADFVGTLRPRDLDLEVLADLTVYFEQLRLDLIADLLKRAPCLSSEHLMNSI